jgi:hypothetical protein
VKGHNGINIVLRSVKGGKKVFIMVNK